MPESEQQANIIVEKNDHVLLLKINRPQVKNAFDAAAAEELSAALDNFESDANLRVAIITGSDSIFSSGADLKAVMRGESASTKSRGGFGIMGKPPRKPIIAAIEGPALAGGFELALCCDLIVASEESVFGLPEVKRSLVAVGGACFRLPSRLPYHLAMEMILTGTNQTAERMYSFGLVNRVTKIGNALNEALELAEQLCKNGPLALQASKEIVRNSSHENWTDKEAWKAQMEYASPVFKSEDFKEGLLAFSEKREPVWNGK
jgi:enoyl-CoA hydratase